MGFNRGLLAVKTSFDVGILVLGQDAVSQGIEPRPPSRQDLF